MNGKHDQYVEYIDEVKNDPERFADHFFRGIKWKWTTHGYVIDGDLIITNIKMKELPFPIQLVKGSFALRKGIDCNKWLLTMKNFPKCIGGNFSLMGSALESFSNPPLTVDGFIFLPKRSDPSIFRSFLLSNVGREITVAENPNISEILTNGRIDGVMPSELIPGKIKQLREING